MSKEIIKKEDWYETLLFDLKKLEFIGIVLTKWNIGKRIFEDELKFGKTEYGSKRVENIAKDLYISERDIYRCIQFYKKCPNGTKSLENKSWHWIENYYLPQPKQENKVLLALPKGKYNIILADPAWDYWAGGYKNQKQHYDSLSLDELANMEVDKLAADNCILFLWATFPILPEAINLISQWGFNYSTIGFVWVKSKKDKTGFAFGLGNWTRSNVELCLIATKGHIERKDASISQIIYEPKEEHSKKPDIVREKILKLIGDLPRIELFARQKVDGWDSWGNQI